MQTEKDQILAALSAWIRQRPQLEYCNYGCPTAYRSEARDITRDLHHAAKCSPMLPAVTASQPRI